MTRRDGNTALVQTNTTNWLVTMDSVCRIFLVDVRTQDVFYSVATPLHGCDNCAGKVSHNPFFACGG